MFLGKSEPRTVVQLRQATEELLATRLGGLSMEKVELLPALVELRCRPCRPKTSALGVLTTPGGILLAPIFQA